MPNKLQLYSQMADEAARQITDSHTEWTAFLRTAGRLYKYPYNEQLMIHAQRPDATACAEFDFWNNSMRRYVRRGSRGIALIDTTGEVPKIRYVFDVSDTGSRENSRSVNLWELKQEHFDGVSTMLERNYDISGAIGLSDRFERVAAQLADEYWNDHQSDILDVVDNSFLEEYDDFNIGVQFRNAATVSITYSLMSRCGLEPEDYFEHEDFLSVFDFNTPQTVATLGTAVSEISQQVLRQIEVTVKNYERIHENEGINLHTERRLPDTQPDVERTAEQTVGQVWEIAESVPEGTPPDTLESVDSVGEAVPALEGDRRDGTEPFGADDAGVDEIVGNNGESESVRPDEVGGADEQLQGAGRGNDSNGADLQLSFFDAPMVGEQISLFPSEDEQISYIEQAESIEHTPFAFSFPQESIDLVLQLGGNNDNSRMRVSSEYMKQKPLDEIVNFLKKEYHGGFGMKTESGDIAAWYSEDGIRLAHGRTAQYTNSAQVIPWSEAAERIGQLLENGQFATNVELVETGSFERGQLAQSLWFMCQDFSGEADERGFVPSIVNLYKGGFPDSTANIAAQLANPEFCTNLLNELQQFAEAYNENRELMRFHLYPPTRLYGLLHELNLPRREYATDMAKLPEQPKFITDDEINTALTHGSSVEGGKGRIYEYFSTNHSSKEKQDFLKNEYGTGGRSHAVSGSSGSYEDHSGKGITLKKNDCANVQLPWNQVVKHIDELVRKGRYLTTEEKTQYEEIQRERIREREFTPLQNDYNSVKEAHPNDIVLYQVGDFFEMFGEDAEKAAELLEIKLTTRSISGAERVEMCGIPSHMLEQYVEKLRDKYDVTISAVEPQSEQRHVYSMPSIDHEAERATDAYEAEFGADGTRAFPGNEPEPEPTQPTVRELFEQYKPVVIAAASEDTAYRNACGHSDRENAGIECNAAVHRAVLNSNDMELIRLFSDMPDFRLRLHQEVFDETYPQLHELLRPLSQDDIDAALQRWNGDIASKCRVQDYMVNHARDKSTAEWLCREYGGNDSKSLFIVRAGSAEEMELPWTKVQRRIAQLVESGVFIVEPERTEVDEMIEQAEKIAAESEVESYERFSVVETDNGYAVWDDIQDGYYIDGEGVTEEFLSEWQAEAYLEEVRKAVSDREIAEWSYVERAKIEPESTQEKFPYSVGDTVYLEDGKPFIITEINDFSVQLQNPTLFYPVFRAESMESFERLMQRYPQPEKSIREAEHIPQNVQPITENFHITDDNLGAGSAKTKFRANIDAINALQAIELERRSATPDEQEILSRYVGWGGLPQAFDIDNKTWENEYLELKAALSSDEYTAARASTLNAHYTSPTVIKAIYETVGNMGFETGNILEPSMGVGNFFGLLPEAMQNSKLYGVELDSITGRIAKQLYPKADITVAGFETTDRRDFFDLAVGNVPFGSYKVNDRAYNKLGFSIHNYFFAKTLDQVRPGGVVAFVTSRYTMDAKDNSARKYIAQRAELLGAIRLPNNAFKANAGTEVTSDIIFLQKRDRPIDIEPDWIHLGQTADEITVNSYFAEHPEMVLGTLKLDDMMYGDKKDITCEPFPNANLADLLHEAVQHIGGEYREAELPELGDGEAIDTSIPADPNVKNFSYTIVDGDVYFRENSRMVKPELNSTAAERVKGMVELRDCVQKLIGQQMDGFISDAMIQETQTELNRLYDNFTAKHGLLNSRGNALAFADDSSYYLLCSLEILNENGELARKADMFTKLTIKPHEVVTSVDTASEALALSISEKACVDMEYMSRLTGKDESDLAGELAGVVFRNPQNQRYEAADEYLSGNVRDKLRIAKTAAAEDVKYKPNVAALEAAQPKDLDASEIEVRLGATWIDKEYIQQFMFELFAPAVYLRRTIEVNYSDFTAEWNITGKSQVSYSDVNAYITYGTDRANAYRILEDTLNLHDIRIYDTVTDPDGKEKRVLNSKETTLAQQKQQAIKDAFQDWIWKDPDRRQTLVAKYNEIFNSTRPREYDGKHITFSGINPEITLREHQLNAVAHILYGGNTLLAHEVGAGKTFEMVAAAMESKLLGLCQKSLFAVPNHLTEQWASEFLRLYPSANILVATKKDFETRNRKKFCARIATGDYDAVIIGHSQFERIPVSIERQERLLSEQIDEISEGIDELKASRAERFTIKQLERTKRNLETRLEKLLSNDRKDDVITFEQLGVDRLYVDEAHNYKNLFLYTKMRNVAGLSTTDAQKSSDMFLKCRYIDEITGNKGVIFATGTPVSNSMTELYTMMRYLQHDTIKRQGLAHFDCWASTFGETSTAIELAPEGTGYRARTRFSKFFNLPELMNLFKEAADIKTSDQLNLPTPTPIYHNVVAQPTEIQQQMVKELSERAALVHSGTVDPSTDNMLKITSDGRKLGLDQRVINPSLPDAPTSKVNMCVDNIYKIWSDGQLEKLTQLVFSDISTPKVKSAEKVAKAVAGNLDSPELHALEVMLEQTNDTADSFTIYDDIREKLAAKGVPREQIAFIHEANTEVRKKELFAKVRSGQVRVLLGSTFKMGAGMNVQDRLVALHDLDCPWRPGDLEQRSGRIIRQGNKNKEVHIFRYVTEATFDAYLWQTVENKQKFISQIMTSKSPVRSCEDIDETALSYAEIKALCAGDVRIKEKMDLDVDVARLKLMKANHQSQQYRLEDNLLRYFPEQIEQCKGFIAGFEADMKTLAENPHPKDGFAGMEVRNDILTDKENAGAALVDTFKDVRGLEPLSVGNYRGFAMSLTVEDFGRDFILTLKGQMTHRIELGKDPRGNLTRIDNTLNNIPERMKTVQNKLENLYTQAESAKAELGKPFPQEDELKTKSARLAELNAELNIDERTPMERMADATVAKSARPSVLEKLRNLSNTATADKTHKKELEVR